MTSEIEVLKDVAVRLDALAIPYMLTGSFAMSYYATPRMTRDIDLVVAIDSQQVSRFISAFADAYYLPEGVISRAVAAAKSFNVIHNASVVKVDIIVRKSSAYRLEEFARRKEVVIEGATISIATKEDLILSKLEWAKSSESALQLGDVSNLLASGCDRAYVDRWANKLGLTELLSGISHG